MGFNAQAFEGSLEKFLEFVHPEERLATQQAFDPESPELPFVINPIKLISSEGSLKYIRLSKDVIQDGTHKIMLIAIKDVSLEISKNFKLSAQNREVMNRNEELEFFNYVTAMTFRNP
ncbi:MAG: hypothetical protein WD431_11290 [Cyclobacteriaceae bacterium]